MVQRYRYDNAERAHVIEAEIIAQRWQDEHIRQPQEEEQDRVRQEKGQLRQKSRERPSDPYSHKYRSAKACKFSVDESEKGAPMEETRGDEERAVNSVKMENVDEPSDVGAYIPMLDGDGDATVSRTEFNQLTDRHERLYAEFHGVLGHIRAI